MQSQETKQQNEFRQLLTKAGCVEEKLHGNLYQTGLPDMLIGLPGGRIILIEAKHTWRYSLKRGEVMGMLRPAQRRFFIQWNAWPVYVLVFSGRGCSLVRQSELVNSATWNEEIAWAPLEDVVEELLRDPS